MLVASSGVTGIALRFYSLSSGENEGGNLQYSMRIELISAGFCLDRGELGLLQISLLACIRNSRESILAGKTHVLKFLLKAFNECLHTVTV